MNKQNLIHKCRGYNLLEILVAIAIIGILASTAVSSYNRYQAKTLIARAIAATLPLQLAINEYYQNNGYLPGASDLGTRVPAGYSTETRPAITDPIANISEIAYWNDTDTCSMGDPNCDGLGASVHRQIEIQFSNPTSVAGGYLSNNKFMLVINLLSGNSITWLCMPYPNSTTPDFDASLLPGGCHNPSLDLAS